jgi:hypothetical protein
VPVPSHAQPVGSEFRVNTYTTSFQFGPSVAVDPNGNFVVVWTSYRQDGHYSGVFGQRYDASGAALGSEFRVNSYTRYDQGGPSIASDASGNFVVIWTSYKQDGHYDGIFGQRYNSEGVKRGGEFQVNSEIGSEQKGGRVASDPNGNFVVVWTSNVDQDDDGDGVFGQRYDSGGEPLGGEFGVNSYTTGLQNGADVASDANGNFVVVWHSTDQDGSDGGIFGQRYDNEGVPQGGEFRVNSYTTGSQAGATVAVDPNGNFVVTWQSSAQDGSAYGVFGQHYDSGGVAQGAEFRVNSYTTAQQWGASVAMDAGGNFVVVRSDEPAGFEAFGRGRGDPVGVFGRRFDSQGVARGDEFRVNSYTTSDQAYSSVASDASGNFVVVWSSYKQDGSSWGIFGRRYQFLSQTITVVSPNTNVPWPIGFVKQIRWTHDLGADATFRIELDRRDDGVFEELIAAAAPADSATSGRFAWTVTGPPSGRARVRISWTDDLSVSDKSDTTFRIKLEG